VFVNTLQAHLDDGDFLNTIRYKKVMLTLFLLMPDERNKTCIHYMAKLELNLVYLVMRCSRE
jgi:hypothetical protein